jgi:NADPH:quinone reductase-like Zn-dependent oxidoreductase
MKAIVFEKYGGPEVLHLSEIPKPDTKSNEVLVRVKATAVNSGDWRVRKADPFMVRLFFGLLKPNKKVLGTSFSGTIEAVGGSVSKYKVGDEVFGTTEEEMGSYAEFISIAEDKAIAPKPKNLNHQEAASIPFGGHTAYHFLKPLNLNPEKHILIYGASGAVGTATIQIAKFQGAKVTAVCSGKNADLVKSLGADEVIDYTKTPVNQLQQKYDAVVETVGKLHVTDAVNLVKDGGHLVLIASLLEGMIYGTIQKIKGRIKIIDGVAKVDDNDMQFLKDRCEAGELRPIIDKSYPLEKMAKAHAYVEAGHKRGNVVITL